MSIDPEDICRFVSNGKCTILKQAKGPTISSSDPYVECDGMKEGCLQYDTEN